MHRAEAIYYPAVLMELRNRKIHYRDEARNYDVQTPWPFRVVRRRSPTRPKGSKRGSKRVAEGVVVLPTGTGKTHLANLAIESG